MRINQLNTLSGYEPTDTPRECNSQPPESYFKPRTSPTKTSPVVSIIIGILNHHDIDNDDVDIIPSECLFKSTSEYVIDPDTTLIKSINDNEMNSLLELFHSENADDIL